MNILTKLASRKMHPQTYSFSTTKEERDGFCASIINSSSPRAGFYLLIVLSTFIVAAGLIKNSIILLIGGMMVAPLLSPILSISLAMVIVDLKVLARSFLIFLISALASLLVAMLIGLVVEFDLKNIAILNLMHSFDYATLLIPIAAGAAASFTWAKKDLNGSLAGVAVTVTLMPPLATMGLALATKSYGIFFDSFVVYLLNVSGIIFGSLIIFLLMKFSQSAKTVIKQVEQEDRVTS